MIDIGGGDSRLADALLERGFTCVSVLDISRAALDRARQRLSNESRHVHWIEADVLGEWSVPPVDLWHDRAVFHFLTETDERRRYLDRLQDTLRPGGVVILATFAEDGPMMCSGLPTCRYSSSSLAAELGHEFELIDARPKRHVTPHGTVQSFVYARFRKTS